MKMSFLVNLLLLLLTMATIRELNNTEEESGAVVMSTTRTKKRKTSADEQTKLELLERRMLGADVTTMDLTGIFDDDEDATLDAYKLALSTTIFNTEQSSSSSSAVCVNENTALRLVDDPNCPVFIYSPPKETDIWTAIAARAEGNKIAKRWEDFPKGIAYAITEAKRYKSERFNNENYAVVINEKFSTFLPTRFTSFIDQIGVDAFLLSKPHVIYFGINPANNAYVILMYPLEYLKKKNIWSEIMVYGKKYLKF